MTTALRSAEMDATEKVNILLVDDQPDKLLAHESILSELGENVIRATSGREALQLLLKNEFAVILLDINMPDIDGFEAAEIIRQRPSLERTPIIFITAYNTSDLDRLRGYHLGGVDYLFLPVVPEVLKAKVQVFVDLAKQKQIIKRQADFLEVQTIKQEEQIRTIQELNNKLRAANEELESFSYTVSHDLRSPLRALEGYSRLLLDEYKNALGDEGSEFLLRINRSARRMDALIRDLLAYGRIWKMEMSMEPIPLDSFVKELLREQDLPDNAEARFQLGPLGHKVLAHRTCLNQCLMNLIENAVKFVPADRSPIVTIRSEACDERVKLWIEDNGIGIHPSFHGNVFNMFQRAHDGRDYEGTGIGLAIVKKGVERMGGTVGFDSKPGNGSKFWIELAPAG